MQLKFTPVILLVLLFSSCSPIRLIIKNDKAKETLKLDMPIIVQEKGEEAVNMGCKSICHECDTTFFNQTWTVDSLRSTSIVIRQDLTFRYDTIPQAAYKARSKYDKKKHLVKVIALNKKAHYVYKVPTESIRKEMLYKEIGYITFTYRAKCYKGLFEKIFANPNKFRQIEVSGASTKLIQ